MTKSEIVELIEIAAEATVVSDPILLTIEQVAVQLGISPQTVRNWEAQGKLVPQLRTNGGHRRYSQKQITDLKKNQELEIFLRMKPIHLLTNLQQVMSNFNPEEQISISIRYDKLAGKVFFTLDSEDGLQTYTKAIKMEES